MKKCATCGNEMLGGMCPGCMLGSALEEDAALVEALPAVGEDYELLERIAEGGMGVVWRARQRRLGRIVALKVLREWALPGEGAARRFRIEAAAAALLRHRHIVTVYEVGEVEGRYFLSMELLEGGSLSERLRKGAMPMRAAVELLGKVARAIQHAHERGVLHRDLKPGNILLDAAGEPHVADFGLARLAEGEDHVTVSGAILGTPAYMSPEQASGGVQGEVTTASDVYSLGVVFYELLTGVLPFRAESQIALLLRVVEAEPARPGSVLPGLDRDLETICLKCLEKKPAARYPTAAALADELDRWLLGEPIAARAVGTPERLWKWARRHKAQAALYTTALLALLAITAISLVFNRQLSRENERTREAERTTRHRLAAQHSIAAERLTNDGDWLRALPHIVENLTLTEGDPAAQRLGRLRFECAVRFSPRLEHLWLPEGAIGGLDYDERAGRIAIFAGSTAQVFDAATGAPFGPPLQHAEPIRDGYLACHSTRIVCQLLTGGWQLWNITQPGSPIASGMGNIFAMDTAGGSQKRDGADGGTLATWHDDDKNDTVQLIDTRTGKIVGEPFHFAVRIDWAFASEDTERLLVVTKDNLLHLLDLHTRQPILPPLAVGKQIILRAFSNDCRTAAFEAKASKGLHIFLLHLPTGQILAETPSTTPSTVHNKHGWLNDRWTMLARADDGFLLRDASTNAELFHPLHRAQGTQASFANQRDTFATAARDSSLRIWDSNGASLTPLLWLSGVTEHLRLSTTGEHLLAASTTPAVRLWQKRADDGATLTGPRRAVGKAIALSDTHLHFTQADGTTQQWSLQTLNPEPATPAPAPVAPPTPDTATSPDGHITLHWGDTYGIPRTELHALDTATGHPLYTLRHENDITSATFSPDGRTLLTTGRDAARLWHTATGASAHTFRDLALPALCGGYSPSGTLLWARTPKEIRIWDTATGTLALPPLPIRGTPPPLGAPTDTGSPPSMKNKASAPGTSPPAPAPSPR